MVYPYGWNTIRSLILMAIIAGAATIVGFLHLSVHAQSLSSCTLHASGDADCNGVVDIADFEIFRKEFTGIVTTKTADFDGDGVVTVTDFEKWRTGYFGGVTVSPTHPAVGNPTATPTSKPAGTATPTPKPTSVVTPTVGPTAPAGSCTPPYAATSPWNTKVAAGAALSSSSARYVSTLTGTFGSDPDQYTYPVYEVTSATPLKTVKLSGVYSNVTNNNATLDLMSAPTVQVPIPSGAVPASGTDSQFIMWNRATGDEWGFWQVIPSGTGYTAKNGYHYNTNWSGVPPDGFKSRGAGVPYFTGLIRPCEIKQGHIDHALAFAYQNVSSPPVYPATKSDGTGGGMPEGSHLQLDPKYTDAQIIAWKCTGTCLIMAHAMQQYGLYVIDFAGHPKVMAESNITAHWGTTLKADTVGPIPYSAFRVLAR